MVGQYEPGNDYGAEKYFPVNLMICRGQIVFDR
jgi:hypothetical protein